MERLLPVLLIVLIVIALPTLAQAEDQPVPGGSGQGSAGSGAGDMDGMDMGGSGSAAPGDPNYKPAEFRADDGGMAALVALVFGFPVVVWLIVRTIKKSARSRRSVR